MGCSFDTILENKSLWQRVFQEFMDTFIAENSVVFRICCWWGENKAVEIDIFCNKFLKPPTVSYNQLSTELVADNLFVNKLVDDGFDKIEIENNAETVFETYFKKLCSYETK